MRIQWTIEKKRGNFRPLLTYTITMESFEIDLAVSALNIKSLIPRIPNAREAYCLPGEDERSASWEPARYHYLSIPSVTYLKDRTIEKTIRLPFRESGEYPEVEASFEALRTAYEEIVKEAYGHGAIFEQDEMDLSPETRTVIAAKVAGAKLLSLYGSEPCRGSETRMAANSYWY